MPLNLNIGATGLVCLGYQRLTVDNVTAQTVTVPPNTSLMTFTCEDNPVRWIAGPDVSELTPNIGNPLPITWAQGFFEYMFQSSSPPSFISQISTARVNVTFYGGV